MLTMSTNVNHIKAFLNPNPSLSLPTLSRNTSFRSPTLLLPPWKMTKKISPSLSTISSTTISVSGSLYKVVGCKQVMPRCEICEDKSEKSRSKKRLFFLDVNPLCYERSRPSLYSFVHWISLFFTQVSFSDPVIAVLDGEGGSEHRRQLLPSYKAHRRKFIRLSSSNKFSNDHLEKTQFITDVLSKCNVPIVKIKGQEADDVVATLARQALQGGYKVVIASPDKDFKQLISDDVHIVMPIPELYRWSFYTPKHYVAQYNCDPSSDLSLRCIMGDKVDGIPGIQDVVPGFGRKTAQKLLKKHGTLENLLNAAAIRTVGKQYVQEALTIHADYLRRNYEVLALRMDVEVHLQEEWLVERDRREVSRVLFDLFEALKERRKLNRQTRSHSSNVEAPNKLSRNLSNCDDNGDMRMPVAETVGLALGQISLFSSPGAAHASDNIKTDALFDIGALFELGIQLSYLLLLLALLGVGTFFVIRQVLVRRELDLSAKELQEQVRSGDASAMEYFELGAVMLRRKFYPAAAKYLQQAIEKWDGDNQDLAQVYNALGVTYVRDGKLDKGITQLETAVKLQPGYVTAWNNLGDAYEQNKDLKSALRAFEEVLLFDPNNTVARPRRDSLKNRVQVYKGVRVKSKDR